MEIFSIEFITVFLPEFMMVEISELIIQIEKAFIITYKRDDSNDKITIKR
jgi:hypothetical protein